MSLAEKKLNVSTGNKPPTYWYNIDDVITEATCPSCGREMKKFKKREAHVKRCFAIRKLGPIYRLHGYTECKCGLLIANNPKARKLHVCVGEVPVPAFEQHQPKLTPAPAKQTATRTKTNMRVLNFSSPIKITEKSPAEPNHRVRNFDMLAQSRREVDEDGVYSIIRKNGGITLTGSCTKLSQRLAQESIVIVRKPHLRLPSLQSDGS